ncbi:hypothetical protein ABW17_20175 [Mycobacterium nebraskense]|uniref:2Fe-2S iron-sulfur cluster-binding protein n=1 Tax=Mycobacterium nebraskense TaxID=244292 RepID=UPI00064229D6|nr:2Fe-2S iron-sulfur cluster binding domain-containing protein [Mycobacterium nebraskense]KLO39308.1 hypothetical protein ABW17_20175 [Mycobacterium nebraskense]
MLRRGSSGARAPQAEPFYVHLQRTGTTMEVSADKTVLQALFDQGVPVDSMCRNGVCGTCQTRLLSGEVEHRDSFLTEDQRRRNSHMMVCVSRARAGSYLMLDL